MWNALGSKESGMWNGSWEDVEKFIPWSYMAVNLNFRGRSGKGMKEGKVKCEINFIVESVMRSIPVQCQGWKGCRDKRH